MVKDNKGFTLVELLVAVSIFAILSTIISGIYLSFSKSQARTFISQSLLNDAQYILETVAKEIKNNEIIISNWGVDNIYKIQKENEDKYEFLYDDSLKKINYGIVGGDKIDLNDITDFKISYFNMYLKENINEQPRVTISLEVKNTTENENEKVNYKLQTTVSSRIYKR